MKHNQPSNNSADDSQANETRPIKPDFEALESEVQSAQVVDGDQSRPKKLTRSEYQKKRATNYSLSKNALPNYGGMARIFLMVGVLLAVLFAMYEAGKPENWKWMGFQDSVELTTNPSNVGSDPLENSNDVAASSSDHSANSNSTIGTESKAKFRTDSQNVEIGNSVNSQKSSEQESEVIQPTNPADFSDSNTNENQSPIEWSAGDIASASRDEFWRQAFKRLKTGERLQFYDFVQSLARAIEADADSNPESRNTESSEKLIASNKEIFQQLDRFRATYHGKVTQLMVAAADDPELNQATSDGMSWSELLTELRQVWENEITPTFQKSLNREPLGDRDREVVSWLAKILKSIALDQIKDGTADIRDIEMPAWSEFTRRLLGQSKQEIKADSLGQIDMTQLLGQTTHYRGKIVSIEGTLLRAQMIRLINPVAERSHIYELWIAPKKRSIYPYCVYALEMPQGFENIELDPVVLRRPITVDGYLFKTRFFTAEDGTAASCPLLLAKIPDVIPATKTSGNVTGTQWGAMPWLALLLVASMIALAVTRLARGSVRQRNRIPGTVEKVVEEKLTNLQDDPTVTTVEERLKKMHE